MGAPLKDKIQVFLFGLMLGLLIAACFFIFKLDGYFKELSFYKSNNKKNTVNEIVTELKEEKTEKTKKYKTETAAAVKITEKKAITDTIVALEGQLSAESDSLSADTVEVNSFSEEIVIKKDELVFSKTVELQVVGSVKDKNETTDTLMQKISGVKKDPPLSAFKIEYWSSPLNYKGYKMIKGRIIVYGISPSENIKLYKVEGAMYFKNSSTLYKMDYTSEFRSLEPVTDEQLLAKIK